MTTSTPLDVAADARAAAAALARLAGRQLAAGRAQAAAAWRAGHRPGAGSPCPDCAALDATIASGLYDPPEAEQPGPATAGPKHAAPRRRLVLPRPGGKW
jgi:hypothetical protein